MGRIILQAPDTHVPKKIREAQGTQVKINDDHIRVEVPDAEDAYFSSGHQVIVVLNHGSHQKVPIPSRSVFAIIWGRDEERQKAINHAFCKACKRNSAIVTDLREGSSRYRMRITCLDCGSSWTAKKRRKK